MSDDGRHGMTIIAFVGSVFSPFYARVRRRAGSEANPLAHCAFNVALYRRFGSRWVFTERDERAVQRRPEVLVVGPNSICRDGDELRVVFDERTAPWGGRLKGTLRLRSLVDRETAVPVRPVVLDSHGKHRWWPLAPAARAEVQLQRPRLRFSGTAYHDCNQGDEPLESGFSSWTWSRAALTGATAVLYDVVQRDGLVCQRGWIFERDGTTRPLHTGGASRLRRSLWLLPRQTRHDAGARARLVRSWEDTPFYSRELVQTRLLDQPVTMVHETLDLDRFASPLVQWMLPYRMRRIRGGNDRPRLAARSGAQARAEQPRSDNG